LIPVLSRYEKQFIEIYQILGITNFMVIIFQTLGLEGDLPLLLIGTYTFLCLTRNAIIDISQGLYSIVGTIAVAAALAIVDHVGRRKMLRISLPPNSSWQKSLNHQ